jgi:hypothetical protein
LKLKVKLKLDLNLMDSEAHIHTQRDRRTDALGDLRVLPDETICSILERLTPRDAARVACVSSVMYILSNEEPLWMTLCLRGASGFLQYKGSWKKTALHNENLPDKYKEWHRPPLHFDGFNSLFLYRRLYRCHTTLDTFYTVGGNVERIKDISLKDFYSESCLMDWRIHGLPGINGQLISCY